MRRLWAWLKNKLSVAEAYSFHHKDTWVDETDKISIEFRQDVYHRKIRWTKKVWRGTVLVRVTLNEVGVYGRDRKVSATSSLRGVQEYPLRCDRNYTELLRHLAVLEIRGVLSVEERLRVVTWQNIVMMLWPPRAGQDVHDLDTRSDDDDELDMT